MLGFPATSHYPCVTTPNRFIGHPGWTNHARSGWGGGRGSNTGRAVIQITTLCTQYKLCLRETQQRLAAGASPLHGMLQRTDDEHNTAQYSSSNASMYCFRPSSTQGTFNTSHPNDRLAGVEGERRMSYACTSSLTRGVQHDISLSDNAPLQLPLPLASPSRNPSTASISATPRLFSMWSTRFVNTPHSPSFLSLFATLRTEPRRQPATSGLPHCNPSFPAAPTPKVAMICKNHGQRFLAFHRYDILRWKVGTPRRTCQVRFRHAFVRE